MKKKKWMKMMRGMMIPGPRGAKGDKGDRGENGREGPAGAMMVTSGDALSEIAALKVEMAQFKLEMDLLLKEMPKKRVKMRVVG
jgi:hypothetical protein